MRGGAGSLLGSVVYGSSPRPAPLPKLGLALGSDVDAALEA
jgi:hypothetical protein